jgi:hypothetical protein
MRPVEAQVRGHPCQGTLFALNFGVGKMAEESIHID